MGNVKAIISAILKFKGPKDAVIHIVDNLFADGETIFEELGEAGKEYKEAKYMGSGHNLGMAFRRILVGNGVPLCRHVESCRSFSSISHRPNRFHTSSLAERQ